MAVDWFRRKTWTAVDEQEFHARLKRCRNAGSKAQYLRIQANELIETRAEPEVRAGIKLLQIMVSDYPAPTELASAYECLGKACEVLGQWDEAVSWYRKALEQQRVFPGVQTDAHLAFALLVAARRRREEYR